MQKMLSKGILSHLDPYFHYKCHKCDREYKELERVQLKPVNRGHIVVLGLTAFLFGIICWYHSGLFGPNGPGATDLWIYIVRTIAI